MKSEDRATYNTGDVWLKKTEDNIIADALQILTARMGAEQALVNSPELALDYLRLELGSLEHEIFACIWLNAQNRLIAYQALFRGTLTQTSVYPREVVKAALFYNACGVILAHNHPSGMVEPSHADEALTQSLKWALALVDVVVYDHIIVAGSKTMSFAQRGLL